MKIFCIIIGCIIVFCACEKENYQQDYKAEFVIDGRIETNGFARVFITRNIPYYVSIDSSNIAYIVIRQARVKVSDGTKSEILTLTYDKKMFPPWYYEGSEIVGVEGRTYNLSVEWGATTITAETTIPLAVYPDSIKFAELTDKAGKGLINLSITDPAGVDNYYKIYTYNPYTDNTYIPTLNSDYSDWYFNGKSMTFSLSKGVETYLEMANQNDFYFNKGDTVWVKLCSVDKNCFEFWKSYRSEAANGANPFASSSHTIKSNISGGLGIWGGYGYSLSRVILK